MATTECSRTDRSDTRSLWYCPRLFILGEKDGGRWGGKGEDPGDSSGKDDGSPGLDLVGGVGGVGVI